MIRSVDRRRYIAARAALREILGSYLRTPPSSLSIACSGSGKPFLENQPQVHPLHFNVSHAGDLALVAVSCGLQVGIDIERFRELKAANDILRDFFGPPEQALVQSHPQAEQAEAFFRVWTRREAAAKAVGMGLMRSFLGFSLPAAPLSPHGFSCMLPASEWQTAAQQQWWVRDFSPADGYAGALCVEKKNAEPVFWRFEF
jgi:4'-phosphopantetheinyl transferase